MALDTIVYAFLGGLLPAIFWLWFWLKEDRAHPEPPALIVMVFIVGTLAIIPAYFLESGGKNVLDIFYSSFPLPGNTLWIHANLGLGITVALWALIEEGLKFAAVYLVAFRHRWFDEPIDAMIYMITGALGFAAAENALFLLSTMVNHHQPLVFLLTGNLRFIGATVVHMVASSLVGGWFGLAFYAGRGKRAAYLAIGLITATLLHALFNYLIITSVSEDILKIFVWLWATAIFIIFFFEIIKKQYGKKKIIF